MKSQILIHKLDAYLKQFKYTFGDEFLFKNQLEEAFKEWGLPYLREYALSTPDRPDFVFMAEYPALIAVEVKIKGGEASHLRQLHRYAAYPTVGMTLLINIKPVKYFPETINNKPARLISLWGNLF